MTAAKNTAAALPITVPVASATDMLSFGTMFSANSIMTATAIIPNLLKRISTQVWALKDLLALCRV